MREASRMMLSVPRKTSKRENDMSKVNVKHFDLMGKKARDVVTNFEGIVECISFDLYGCIQALLRPIDKGDKVEARWLDVKRIKILNQKPVMDVPDFTVPEIGAAEKPIK